jgi:hypothetical protein
LGRKNKLKYGALHCKLKVINTGMMPQAQSSIFALAGTKRKWFCANVKAQQG